MKKAENEFIFFPCRPFQYYYFNGAPHSLVAAPTAVQSVDGLYGFSLPRAPPCEFRSCDPIGPKAARPRERERTGIEPTPIALEIGEGNCRPKRKRCPSKNEVQSRVQPDVYNEHWPVKIFPWHHTGRRNRSWTFQRDYSIKAGRYLLELLSVFHVVISVAGDSHRFVGGAWTSPSSCVAARRGSD